MRLYVLSISIQICYGSVSTYRQVNGHHVVQRRGALGVNGRVRVSSATGQAAPMGTVAAAAVGAVGNAARRHLVRVGGEVKRPKAVKLLAKKENSLNIKKKKSNNIKR